MKFPEAPLVLGLVALVSACQDDTETLPQEPVFGAQSSMHFGTIEVMTSAARMLRIRNDGGGMLKIDDIEVMGKDATAFAHSLAVPLQVGPGGFVEMPIVFTPLNVGPYSAQLRIMYSGRDQMDREHFVTLLGQGQEPVAVVADAGFTDTGHRDVGMTDLSLDMGRLDAAHDGGSTPDQGTRDAGTVDVGPMPGGCPVPSGRLVIADDFEGSQPFLTSWGAWSTTGAPGFSIGSVPVPPGPRGGCFQGARCAGSFATVPPSVDVHYLVSPEFMVPAGSRYRVRFWHWYHITRSFSGWIPGAQLNYASRSGERGNVSSRFGLGGPAGWAPTEGEIPVSNEDRWIRIDFSIAARGGPGLGWVVDCLTITEH